MNFRTIVLGASSILISAAPGYAQTQRQPVFNHPLTTFRDLSGSRSGGTSAPETLRILTAMVAFQEDSDPRTTGNGSFDTTAPARNLLDPPPHDSAYVQHHLTFAANYFRKVSDGRLIVTGDVLGPVYRLPYPMQHYSPPRGTTNNLEVGLLMRDSWHLIDSVTPGISFGTYQVFLLVHAGAGRDIDLTSIYGFDPTPFDIPSIYLNLKSLKKMFGDSYQGVPVAGGTFLIPNSIILPETENRILESAVGSSTLQLGINGLLAASVGSHLGLPDLFDTKTGASDFQLERSLSTRTLRMGARLPGMAAADHGHRRKRRLYPSGRDAAEPGGFSLPGPHLGEGIFHGREPEPRREPRRGDCDNGAKRPDRPPHVGARHRGIQCL